MHIKPTSEARIYACMQAACYWLMRALKRRSIVIFAMALLMVISMVIIYYEAVLNTITSVREHRLGNFGGICS